MTLNWRHKADLFLTLIAVGCGFFLELSVKQTVGIALLGIAFAWLIGSLTLRTLMVTFAILICAVGGYVAGTPIWGDWNSVRNSAAQYDFAIADLRAAVKGALAIVSSVPIPPGVTIGAPVSPGDPIPPDAIIGAPRQGAKPKKQGQSTLDDIGRTRTVTIPDSAKIWMRSEVLPPLPKGYMLAKPSQPVIWGNPNLSCDYV